MTETCTVKKITRGNVYVELVRKDECDGCKMCAFNNKKSIVVPAACGIAVDVGQTVEVEMPTRSPGAASLLIYAVPLLLILAGALIGLVGGVWLQIGLAACGLILGLVAAFLLDRAYRKMRGMIPTVKRVIDISEASEGE